MRYKERDMIKWLGLFFCIIGQIFGDSLTIDSSLITDKRSVKHVVIIGSGPAGCTAAQYCASAGFDTLVLEGPLPGGQLTETSFVENWPGIKKERGITIMDGQRQQAHDAGANFSDETVVSVDVTRWPFVVTTNDGKTIQALALILATGSQPRTLGIEGEKAYWGYGVSTCAVCDARRFVDKNVVVVGGGDSAVEQALQLSLYARSVTILVRGAAMRARWSMQNKLVQLSNVHIEYNKEITHIYGQDSADEDKEVIAIDIYDNVTQKTQQCAIDGVFLAIGHTPRSQLVHEQVDCDEQGYIKLSDRSQATSVPGVFAAGEVADSVYRQAAVANGDGCKAAIDAVRFLNDHDLTVAKVRECCQAGV